MVGTLPAILGKQLPTTRFPAGCFEVAGCAALRPSCEKTLDHKIHPRKTQNYERRSFVMMVMKTENFKISTPTDTEVVVTREFNAPRHLIWEAWTNPKHVPQWMLGPEGWTMPVCEIDLRPGGAWHFVWRKND